MNVRELSPVDAVFLHAYKHKAGSRGRVRTAEHDRLSRSALKILRDQVEVHNVVVSGGPGLGFDQPLAQAVAKGIAEKVHVRPIQIHVNSTAPISTGAEAQFFKEQAREHRWHSAIDLSAEKHTRRVKIVNFWKFGGIKRLFKKQDPEIIHMSAEEILTDPRNFPNHPKHAERYRRYIDQLNRTTGEKVWTLYELAHTAVALVPFTSGLLSRAAKFWRPTVN